MKNLTKANEEEQLFSESIDTIQENIVQPKKSFSKRAILSWLSALSILALALLAGYIFYQRYQLNPLKQIAQISSKYGSSYAPGESTITKYPDSIQLTTDFSIPARHIFVPNLKISFNTPVELRTGQELKSSIADEANWASVVRLYRDNVKYTKDTNGYDVPDSAVVFSFDYPYGNDPIDGIGQGIADKGNIPYAKPLLGEVSFKQSILASRSAVFYSYLDKEHYRYEGKQTDTYKGYIRVDVVTGQGKHAVFGVIYTCYDQVNKNLCKDTFQMFVSSLKIEDATVEAPPPTYSEADVFETLPFVKKNLNTEKELWWYNVNLFAEPIYKEEKVPVIAALKDEDLQNIRCLPQQLYFRDGNSLDPSEIMGVYVPQITDPNLQNIITQLKSRVPQGYALSQFIACQTEQKNYLIKYNVNPQYVERTKDTVVHAKIATLDSKGNFEDIVDIPNRNSYCSHFIALTKDNMLYFACVPFYDDKSNGIDMYKIDISKKEYNKVYSCVFPNPAGDMSKFCK